MTFEIHRLEGHAMKEVQPRLMTTRDTAIYLSVSEAALKAWRVRGGGPPWIKVGHAVRYDLQDVDSWIAQNRSTPGAAS